MIRPTGGQARVLATCGGVLLACRLAAAAPEGGFSLRVAGRLQAGSTVTVSWALDPSAAPRADEMELVLSLDGGATFPIRLTGRIAPATRSVVWRVPALPTQRGRLALRAGTEEEAETEEMLFSSEPFVIEAPPGTPAEPLFTVGGEWRTQEALEGAPATPLARDLGPGDSSPSVEPLDLDDTEPGTGPAAIAVLGSQSTTTCARTPAKAPEAPRTEISFRASLPLRL